PVPVKGYGRQSRSRQPAGTRDRNAPPCCIDRDTLLKINRRPLQRRHRSCDNVWPPRSPSASSERRPPSPSGPTHRPSGETFAIDSRRYGSHDSIHFDERIRRQHKIEPLRTLFDRENVVLTDWGHRPDKNDNHVYGSDAPGTTATSGPAECLTPDVKGDCSSEDGAAVGSDYRRYRQAPEETLKTPTPPPPPPPPPRRYYLPMDKIVSGELEAMLRLFQDTSRTSPIPERRSITPSGKPQLQLSLQHERSKSAQGQARLQQDGIDSKPPLSGKHKSVTGRSTTPHRATPLLQRHATVTDVSALTVDDAVGAHHEFNLNSNTEPNLNIDRRWSPKPTPKQSCTPPPGGHSSPLTCDELRRSTTVPQPVEPVEVATDQLTTNYFDKQYPEPDGWSSLSAVNRFPVARWTPSPSVASNSTRFPLQADHTYDGDVSDTGHERPVHNYNEKLITDAATHRNADDTERHRCAWTASPELVCQRLSPGMSRYEPVGPGTHVAYPSCTGDHDENANDNLQRHHQQQQQQQENQPFHRADCNYDNKSVRSHYHREASTTDNAQLPDDAPPRTTVTPPLPPYPEPTVAPWRRQRARSGSSGSSVKINEIFEFPPPPPYPCDCETAGTAVDRCQRPTDTVNGSESDDACAGDTGRDYSTSEQINHPGARCMLSEDVATVKITAASPPPPDTVVNLTIFPSLKERTAVTDDDADDGSYLLTTVDLTGGDNDVTGVQTPAAGPNDADVDYFKANLTDDKTLDALASARVRSNFHEAPGKHDTDRARPTVSDHSNEPFSAAENRRNEGRVHDRRMISFTDGEFIFGPFDERSLEFGRFELLNDHTAGEAEAMTAVDEPTEQEGKIIVTTLPAAASSPTDRGIDAENNEPDDGGRQIAIRSDTTPTANAEDYRRWARFENGNVSPPLPQPPPTSRPSSPSSVLTANETAKRRTRGEDIEDIFEQLNHSLKVDGEETGDTSPVKETAPSKSALASQLVENVPVIERILDDLLTFSKQLLEQKQQLVERAKETDTVDANTAGNHVMAPAAKTNDDNLINLSASDDDAVGIDKSYEGPGVSIDGEDKNLVNNDDNHAGDVSAVPQREDPFANVAIFNWNPLDVYQQHGLFMIDPRFALADMRAAIPCTTLPTVPEEIDSNNRTCLEKTFPISDPSSTSELKTPALDCKMSPTSNVPMSTDRVGATVETTPVAHCYDQGHVRYPLGQDDQRELTALTDATNYAEGRELVQGYMQ
uniref:Uncharacterized protein n=1 Tax=Anopheles farauti TaxID=69004 RepID=A0A182Q6U7_9DIPT